MLVTTSYPAGMKARHDDIGDVPIADLIDAALDCGEFIYDLETTGLSPRKHSIDGIALYVPATKTAAALKVWYPFVPDTAQVPVYDCRSCDWSSFKEDDCCRRDVGKMDQYYCPDCGGSLQLDMLNLRPAMDHEDTFEAMRPLFEHKGLVNWAYHRKFDDGFVESQTPIKDIKNIRADPMLMVFLIDENPRQFGLKPTTSRWFKHKMVTFKEAQLSRQGRFAFDFKTPLCEYAMDDCYWTWRVKQKAIKEIGRIDITGRLEKIFWGIDMPVSRIIQEMEMTGVLIDYEHLDALDKRLEQVQTEVYEREIEELTEDWDKVINLGSQQDKSNFLFGMPVDGGLGLPTTGLECNAKGFYSTKKESIKHLKYASSAVSDVLEWSSLATLRSSFTIKLRDLAQESNDGRIYTHFNQTGTKIARLSCISGESVLDIRVGDSPETISTKISNLLDFKDQDVRIVTHKGREKRITHLINKGPELMYEVTTDDGRKIKCTEEHRFLTFEGWRCLKEIKRGDRLLRAEVCSSEEGYKGSKVVPRSTFVPSSIQGRSSTDTVEDREIRSIERRGGRLPGGIRRGVSRVIQRESESTRGSERYLTNRTDLDKGDRNKGFCSDAGVFHEYICEQFDNPRRGKKGVWYLSQGSSGCQETLHSGVRRSHEGEEKTLTECFYGVTDGLLPQSDNSDVIEFRQIDRGSGGNIRGGVNCYHDGHGSLRDIREFRECPHVAGFHEQSRFENIVEYKPRVRESNRFPRERFYDLSGNLSASCPPFGKNQKNEFNFEVLQKERGFRERSPHIRLQQGRNEVIQGIDGFRNKAHQTTIVLQELPSGFCLEEEKDHGRGRWRVSPKVPRDDAKGSGQREEGQGTWLHSDQVHYQESNEEFTFRHKNYSASSWSQIASIVPAGIEDVWDITVEDDASYVAHGFVNHNSSSPFNGQNIPRASTMHGLPGVRYAFCSALPWAVENGDDMLLFGADFSQIELRVAAHLACDPVMIDVYQHKTCKNELGGMPCERYIQGHSCLGDDCSWSGFVMPGSKCPECGSGLEWESRCRHMDLHQRTADDVGVPRALAKALNFGNLYRQGPNRFCETAGLYNERGVKRIPYAREIQDGWMELYSGIPQYHRHVERQLKKNGWVSFTISGRRRRLKELADDPDKIYRAVTQGIQFAISGSAQDIMKISMIKIWEAIRELVRTSRKVVSDQWKRVKFLLQVHDELILQGPECLEDEIKNLMTKEMEGSVNPKGFKVPLVVEAKSGRTWTSIH